MEPPIWSLCLLDHVWNRTLGSYGKPNAINLPFKSIWSWFSSTHWWMGWIWGRFIAQVQAPKKGWGTMWWQRGWCRSKVVENTEEPQKNHEIWSKHSVKWGGRQLTNTKFDWCMNKMWISSSYSGKSAFAVGIRSKVRESILMQRSSRLTSPAKSLHLETCHFALRRGRPNGAVSKNFSWLMIIYMYEILLGSILLYYIILYYNYIILYYIYIIL